MRRCKRWICVLLILMMIVGDGVRVYGAPVTVSSPSYILMEASTGTIICEQGADERRSPASITKIMTLYLIFDAIESGTLSLTDEVTTSAHAKSMGGSQVFLEEGEIQTVDTMIKCIAVASGNDASVAMAEKIAGSEPAFVELMNATAEKMGLKNTHFVDCCGLSNSDEHYTSAKDVAMLSRALITEYPEVFNYTGIWMEDITHVTNKGSSTFTLASTNKLLKQYEYATGLKTGSTDKAKYCVSATARKDDIELIAVVMAAPDYKVRFQDAKALLEYGFSVCKVFEDENQEKLSPVPVSDAMVTEGTVDYKGPFHYLDLNGNDVTGIEKKIVIKEEIKAPIKTGDVAGSAQYYLNGKKIGSVDIVFTQDIEKATLGDYFKKALQYMLL